MSNISVHISEMKLTDGYHGIVELQLETAMWICVIRMGPTGRVHRLRNWCALADHELAVKWPLRAIAVERCFATVSPLMVKYVVESNEFLKQDALQALRQAVNSFNETES